MNPLRHWTGRYSFAVVAVLLGHLLRLALTAWVGPGLPTYITFYPFVMAVALLAGFGPGVLATALTGVVVGSSILPPIGQWSISTPVAPVGLALFFCMGLLMSTVAELYRRNRAKAAAYDRETALRETSREKEFLASLLEHAEQPFAVGYFDGRLGLMNRAYEQLTGYTAAELRTLDWSTVLTPPVWRDHERQKLEELYRTGQPVRYEKEYIRKDGTRVPIELFVNLRRDAAGQPEFYYAFITDITDRKRAEAALRKAHDELEIRVQERTSELAETVQRLQVEILQRKHLEETLRESEKQVRLFASQCLTAQETERRRIAAELHDSTAASLAAIKFRIENTVQEMKQGRGNPESMQDLASTIAEIINDVRRIMVDLRPSILDDLGIIAAVNWFCREYEKTYSHISVEKQIGTEEREVPDSVKTPIFRITQEAMNNIAKHSMASLVNVSLQKEDKKLLLTIQDNGGGFDPESVKRGMGLSTIRERAELSGGSAELQSGIGKGTTVRIWWPI